MRTEMIRCKVGNNAVFSTRHKFDASHVKKTSVSFSSLSCDSARKIQISLKRNFAVAGFKRGHTVIVAASPPTDDTVVVTEPLTKKDLVEYLASGCKPKEKWRSLFYFILICFLVSHVIIHLIFDKFCFFFIWALHSWYLYFSLSRFLCIQEFLFH